MTPSEMHKAAVSKANTATLRRFGVYGPYEVGTPEHDYWLTVYDEAMTALILAHGGREDK